VLTLNDVERHVCVLNEKKIAMQQAFDDQVRVERDGHVAVR